MVAIVFIVAVFILRPKQLKAGDQKYNLGGMAKKRRPIRKHRQDQKRTLPGK